SFTDTTATTTSTLSLHDALPILTLAVGAVAAAVVLAPPFVSPFFEVTPGGRRFHKMAASEAIAVVALLWWGVRYLVGRASEAARSEEHTSELQSRGHLVCRLLLE